MLLSFRGDQQGNTGPVDNPTSVAWSTAWDTASAAGKAMPQQAVAANLVLTRDDTGSVLNGYTTAPLAVSGAGLTVTVDGTALALTQGLTYVLTLKNVAGAALWMLRRDVNAGTIVMAVPPAWASAPVLASAMSGTAASYSGTASGSPAPSYSYQWTLNGVAIGGATAATYTPGAGDVSGALRVVVTASNAAGSAVGTSNAVTVAAAIVATPAYTMTQLASTNRIYQRVTRTGGGAGSGFGTVPVSVNLAGPASKIEFRRRSVADGVTIRQGWTDSLAGVLGSGPQTINLQQVDAQAGWDFIDLRANMDDASIKLGTTPVAVGMLGLLSGQSMMVYSFNSQGDVATIASAGVTVTANGVCFTSVHSSDGSIPTAWLVPSDGQTANKGAGAAELLAKLSAAAGVNVALVSKCQGATGIDSFLPGSIYGDALLATADAAGGAFEFVWWYQGHNDVGMATETYKARLATLFAAINAHNSFADPTILVSSIPNAAASWGAETVRRVSHEWAVSQGYTPVVMNDLELGVDITHPTQVGAKRQAWHAYRALRPFLGYTTNDEGATLGAPTHAVGSAAIVIPFTLKPGATALVTAGNPSLRYFAYKWGDRTTRLGYAASNPFVVDNVAKTITLNLAADPGQIALEVCQSVADQDNADGSANNVWDDATDGDGITVGRLLNWGPRSKRIWPVANLTTTSAAYAAGKFGSAMSAGYGNAPFSVLPASKFGMTISMWVNVKSSGALSVFFASGNSWIGAQGFDLRVSVNGGSQTFAGLLPVGLHHVAVQVIGGSNSATAYVDGVPTASWASGGYTTSGVTQIRNLNGSFVPTAYDIDEVAVFEGPLYSGAFTPPTAAYVGNEPNLVALWHLNGDGLSAASPAA